MGSEFGQWREWNHDRSLDWHLLDDPAHAGLRRYVQALNWHYRAEPALHECDFDPAGLPLDRLQRQREQRHLVRPLRARSPDDFVVMRLQLHAGAARATTASACPTPGYYAELLNSDARCSAAATSATAAASRSEPVAAHGFDQSLAPDGAAARLPVAQEAR